MILTKVKSTCEASIRLHRDPEFTPSLLHHLFKCLHIFSFFKHNPFPDAPVLGVTDQKLKLTWKMKIKVSKPPPPPNIVAILTQRNSLAARRFPIRFFYALRGCGDSILGLIFVGLCGFVSRCNGMEERQAQHRTQPFICCKKLFF